MYPRPVAGESLRVTAGPAAGAETPLGDELLLGRAAAGFGNLGNDPELSRDHARISRYVTGEIVIEDLGSTNGTFVNGWAIEQPTALIVGTVVKVGRSEILLV
jgi:FHA domain